MLCSTISTVRLAATLLISCADAVDVFEAHALGRLVEQHQRRLHRQRGGDLEGALAPVAELDGRQLRSTCREVDRFGAGSIALVVEARAASARPARSGTRCRAFSAGRRARSRARERCANTAEIWNERTTPRRAIVDDFCDVMSSPSNRIWPEVGTRNLVSRLKQVVLPAPFGPISAWMVPRRTRRFTLSTAMKPLNSLVIARVSRMKSSPVARRAASPGTLVTAPPCALMRRPSHVAARCRRCVRSARGPRPARRRGGGHHGRRRAAPC